MSRVNRLTGDVTNQYVDTRKEVATSKSHVKALAGSPIKQIQNKKAHMSQKITTYWIEDATDYYNEFIKKSIAILFF